MTNQQEEKKLDPVTQRIRKLGLTMEQVEYYRGISTDFNDYDLVQLEQYADMCAEDGTNWKEQLFPPKVPEWISQKIDKETGKVKSEWVNCPMLAKHIREHEHYLFVKNSAMGGENRFWYRSGYYQQIPENEIKSIIKQYIMNYNENLLKMKDVNEVFQNIITDNCFVDEAAINSEENFVNMKDGILDLNTWELLPHDPGYHITRQIPVKWADCVAQEKRYPTLMKYLAYLLEGSTGNLHTEEGIKKQLFLMEYMGACLSNVKGWRYKTALIMWGKHDSGKSQLRSLMEYLLGMENCATIDLCDFEARFGTSKIYNKRMIGHGDMSFMKVSELRNFKSITGGDTIDAEYKGKNGFSFVFDGFAWFCANDKPAFGGDQGDGVYKRFSLIHCPYAVPEEKQDRRLQDKLRQEAPAIVYDCLKLFKQTLDRGYRFSEPSSMEEERKKYKAENDTFTAWFEECCVECEVKIPKLSKQDTYNHYKAWANNNEKNHSLSRTRFYKAVRDRFGDCEDSTGAIRYFKTFSLAPDEEAEFLTKKETFY